MQITKWQRDQFNPFGRVIAVVRNAAEKQINLLEEKYEVQKSFSKDAVKQAKEQVEKQAAQETDKVNHKVENYLEKVVFTIDEPRARALDDALSVEELYDGYQFGIHIADVSAQVPHNSHIDKDARKHCRVFYPVGREQWPMLPEELSAGICSLLPEQNRATISVFIMTDSNYKIRDVDIKRCQIRSKYQLTYEQAEEIIADVTNNSDLSLSIRRLKEAAVSWRRDRLGNDKCYRRPKMMSMNCITARTLVEEMMIMANRQVAIKLVYVVPLQSPLRHKLPQTQRCLEYNSLNGIAVDEFEEDMQLSRSMWIALQSEVSSYPNDNREIIKCNMELIKCLVSNIEHQPQLALESANLNKNNAAAKYICSGKEQNRSNWQHCRLNVPQYVHFTSPIRRYIDIVVHRILLSVIDGTSNTTEAHGYTTDDIAQICEECNDARSRARLLKYDSCSIRLCSLLSERSVVVCGVVHSLSDSHIMLVFPNLQSVFSTNTAVKFSSLKPSALPDIRANTVTLKWKQRIYDLLTHQGTQSINGRAVELNQKRYLVKVKSADWKEVFDAVTAEDNKAVATAVAALCTDDDQNTSSVDNLTSEGHTSQSGKHFCEYKATFSRTCIVKVQLAAKDACCGRPLIQLFHLTPMMSVCTEHNNNIVESFSKPATEKTGAIEVYDDIGHYQKIWLPVLAAEAAYSAVANGDSIIIHNVDIQWTQRKSRTTGTFEITTEFCEERNIKFPTDEEPAMHDSDAKGYMCVRYSDCLKPVVKKESSVDTFKDVIGVDKPFTWVGHCVVTNVCISLNNNYYVIRLLLKQNTCSLPEKRKKATIEWIPRLVPDR